MEWLSIPALIVSVIAAVVAIWQAQISRAQLNLARDTEARTERALEKIQDATGETRQIVQDVKANIDERINKLIDSKLDADQRTAAQGDKISEMLMGKLAESFGIAPEEKQ